MHYTQFWQALARQHEHPVVWRARRREGARHVQVSMDRYRLLPILPARNGRAESREARRMPVWQGPGNAMRRGMQSLLGPRSGPSLPLPASERRLSRRMARRGEAEWLLSSAETVRLALLLYVCGGTATLGSTLLPAPSGANNAAVAVVGVGALLTGVILALWHRWPRWLSLAAVVPAFILIALHNSFEGGDPYRYSIYFILVFGWTGITQPRGASLRILPLFVPAYLLPLVATGHWSPVTASSIVYVAPLCVLISETLAWGAQRASAAEHLAALREDFVSSVSHELRTPLTAIVGYAELLDGRWDELDDERRRRHVAAIVRAANRQSKLVEDLLQISRLQRTEVRSESERVVVAAVVHRAARMVSDSYRGQVVHTHGSDGLCALASASRLEQVLTNLLDNAAKYSPEGADVQVLWTAHRQAWRLACRSGPQAWWA